MQENTADQIVGVSIIAPMYNEESNVESTFKTIKDELEKQRIENYEIIFVNDGSTDNTLIIAKELQKAEKKLSVIGYKINQGRGKAIRTGIDVARGNYIVTIDFDLSYDASHISRMLKVIKENESIDAVLASCYMPGGETIGVPKFRLFISRTANLLYKFAYDPPIHTSTCVVRTYRKNAIKGLELSSNDKEIHLEIITKLQANGFNIKEIPATLRSRKKGKSKLKFKAQSIAHVIYFIQERPFALFGMLGMILFIIGFASSFILLYTRFGNDLAFNNTFISKLVSPNFVIILFLSGLQTMGLGFLGIQNNLLKKEMFKLQRMVKQNPKE